MTGPREEGGRGPEPPGVRGGRLAPCPGTPNCVCSDWPDTAHAVDPLRLRVDAARAWPAVHALVAALPRTVVVTVTEDYLHAECRSRVFRFVDDLELHLRSVEGLIAVRSAARIGHSDLGVNRRRVDRIRAALREREIAD